ncbi:MAG TPA: membrane protein insertase YidC [Kineosporiaceae bacterium]|jgi:YidC/Oxa1 family membrane protein insertase|nr:membrane protein insertase YidC [Kineosporiaceae bacterium]
MSVLDTALAPLELALSYVLVTAHATLAGLPVTVSPGVAWAASIAVLVVGVRLALLPLVVRQVRAGRRLAAAGPALKDIRDRYRGRRDAKAVADMRAETARVYAEAGVSPFTGLPLLLQAPVLFSLYRVLNGVAHGQAVGVLGATLAAQLDGATLAGAGLTQTVLAGGPAAVVAVALVLVMAGTLWLAQHRQLTRNTPPAALEGTAGTAARATRWVLPGVALLSGLTLPIGMLVYLACANTLSLLQQLAVIRWLPTPGSPAAAR